MDQEEPEIQTSGMLCPNCAGRNPASVSFCAHCGQPTRPENGGCSSCLAELPPNAQFCPECGAPAGIPIGWFLPAEPEYMGFWIRAAARLIDATIIGAIVVLMEIFYGPLSTKAIILLFACIVYPLYYVAPTGLRGQTLGKMALGIMVVNAQGEPPGITKAIVREILGKFVSEMALFMGYVWIGRDDKKQGWHDHTNPAGKTRDTLEVVIMNYRLFLMEPKRVYPHLVAKGTVPECVVAEWQPNMGDGGMWCEIERHFPLKVALADIEMYIKRFPEEKEKQRDG